ncbi:protein kinase [Sorangium cellulosum]|uniref:non-specific serine/threonine protein kinase n=1 Tax=Sorangium cellulosum TaxID=56 RepID=A0A2L0EQ11_SORCE|nr:serine/threonine-protein kinase [Sorangium cellulosum]AUX41388.1 protein kinase [Sorangium cellulosum]
MPRCPACNAESPGSARFCVTCGSPLAAPGAAGVAARSPAGARAVPTATVPGQPLPDVLLPEDGAHRGSQPHPEAGDADASRRAPAPQVLPAPLAGSLPRRMPGGHLPAGTLIDQKYVIERVLGEGGMGVVYLARDVHTGLHVVLKAVRQELGHRPDVRARTLAEGRALAQIDHPNVVHLKAVVAERDELWLVMQYIDGESLEQKLARYAEEHRPMPLPEALSIFRQIASGISAAHHEGVIHRDLKPANVLIRAKDGVAKVTDFGIAKAEADALAGRGLTKGIIGSLYYMSPEQVLGQRALDKRVDIYALGVVLYEMLVGRVPFDAESDIEIMRLHAEVPLPSVSAARRDVPPELDALLQKACAKDRADRFASCEEMLAALDTIARPTRPVPSSPPLAGSSRPPPAATTVDEARDAALSPGAALGNKPSRAPRARRPWLAIGVGILAIAGGAAALRALGVLDGQRDGRGRGATPQVSPPAASASGAAADAGASEPPPSPLEALTGLWVGNGRELEAVLAGETLEFRVRRPEQFAPQDYEEGEARFSLREIPGETGVFAVEDRIRFIAPEGGKFDPARSRGTCQEVRSAVDGRPLRASFDGARLSVEFAKIEPSARNFVMDRNRVVSCVRLSELPSTRVVSTLTRP